MNCEVMNQNVQNKEDTFIKEKTKLRRELSGKSEEIRLLKNKVKEIKDKTDSIIAETKDKMKYNENKIETL